MVELVGGESVINGAYPIEFIKGGSPIISLHWVYYDKYYFNYFLKKNIICITFHKNNERWGL